MAVWVNVLALGTIVCLFLATTCTGLERHLSDVADASNQIALNLYRSLAEASGTGPDMTNLIFSPLGVSSSLAMTLLGAQGKDAATVRKLLSLDEVDPHALYPSLRNIQSSLKETSNSTLYIASEIFLSQQHQFKKQFLIDSRLFYNSYPELVDFSRPGYALQHINQWGESATDENIKGLLSGSVLDASAESVLASTIFLKGSWLKGFQKARTKESTFVTNKGPVRTELMFQQSTFPYGVIDALGAQVAELPFAGNTLKMVVAVPMNKNGLKALEDGLRTEHLKLAHEEASIDVFLPKLEMESSFSLGDAIKELGVDKLVLPTEGADVDVSHVVHKARMVIDEEGGEETGPEVRGVQQKRIILNRPFLFYVQHVETGAVVVMGRVANPAQNEPPSSTSRAQRAPRDEL